MKPMVSLHERILAVLRARRDEYVRMIEALVAEAPGPRSEVYGPAEAGQMIDGLLTLLAEDLEARGDEARSFFLQTAIPSMLTHGAEPSEIVSGAVRHCVLMVTDAVCHLGEDDREPATQWFSKFFGDYVADVAAATRLTES